MPRLRPQLARISWGAGAGVALVYALSMWLAYPYQRVFQFNPDEGVTAIKALLVGRGVPLYSEIWSDQPPLFIHLLTAWHRLFGWDVDVGRLLPLGFAALLVFGVYELARRSHGHAAALAAATLLCLSVYYRRLSVSLMIGLPSVSLVTLAVLAALPSEDGRRRRAAFASGTLFGLSLSIKLFVLPLAPIPLALIAWGAAPASRSELGPRIRAAAAWTVSAGTTVALVLLLGGGWAALDQLLGTHLVAQTEMTHAGGWKPLGRDLMANGPLIGLSLLGALLALRSPGPGSMAALAWAVTSWVVLLAHRPYWYHHQLLLSVPSALLAGVALGEAFGSSQHGVGRSLLRASAALLVIAWLARLLVGGGADPEVPTVYHADLGRIVSLMQNWRDETRFVVTDVPMFAVRAGLPVPPALAVVTNKRLSVGALTTEDFVSRIEADRPEQVLLANRLPPDMHRDVVAALEGRYVLVATSPWPPRPWLFLRKDLNPDRARDPSQKTP